MHIPEEFHRKMKHLLGEEAEKFLAALQKHPVKGLRINQLKTKKESFWPNAPFSLSQVPFCQDGFYFDETKDEPGKHPYHAAGLYYIQEPSAMLPAQILGAKPGEAVLDLCAAPGGKTTQIAAMMNNKGILVSNEINAKRAKVLSENIERLAITNAIVMNERPEKLPQQFPNYFDRILVDAPCSGEGMFRKDETAAQFWSSEHVKKCSFTQKELLHIAYRMLKPGGTIVYSTCTFSPEENEQVIESFIQTHSDMMIAEIPKEAGFDSGRVEWTTSGMTEISKTVRLWPHKIKGEGHFAAKLIKKGVPEAIRIPLAKSNVKKKHLPEFDQFVQSFLKTKLTGTLYLRKQQLYLLPENCPDFSAMKVLRAGLHLGELKKNRFEPNHHLALLLKPEEAQFSYSLSSKENEWQKYLKGEAISTSKHQNRGWLLMTIDGYSIGWGKEVQGTIKNFYPKGLRKHFP